MTEYGGARASAPLPTYEAGERGVGASRHSGARASANPESRDSGLMFASPRNDSGRAGKTPPQPMTICVRLPILAPDPESGSRCAFVSASLYWRLIANQQPMRVSVFPSQFRSCARSITAPARQAGLVAGFEARREPAQLARPPRCTCRRGAPCLSCRRSSSTR
uniref:Uncharacterized protein n=1 Tax=Bradyrhizobium japonicum TaxID=375 RepID=Q9RHB8_BRAJP|nr:hypothetical protein [Bradyrhizobium japonicum]